MLRVKVSLTGELLVSFAMEIQRFLSMFIIIISAATDYCPLSTQSLLSDTIFTERHAVGK